VHIVLAVREDDLVQGEHERIEPPEQFGRRVPWTRQDERSCVISIIIDGSGPVYHRHANEIDHPALGIEQARRCERQG
jgi:hypothetical protein